MLKKPHGGFCPVGDIDFVVNIFQVITDCVFADCSPVCWLEFSINKTVKTALDNRTRVLYNNFVHLLRKLILYLRLPLYQGDVQLYLEGQGALQVVNIENFNQHIYFIGSPESEIVVKDFREESIHVAKNTLNEEQSGIEFADVFNQPAKVKVYKYKKGFEIKLYKGKVRQNTPILWMGIIRNHQIPARKVQWKIIKPINETDMAFVILTPQSQTKKRLISSAFWRRLIF